MYKSLLISMYLSCIGFIGHSVAQPTDTKGYPQDYFTYPVNQSKIILSGSFGEMRKNHFHSGIDIKPSKQGLAEPILAAADGYVSRIKVEPSGYGKALYITHPNGYTTVYAHLSKFDDDIANYIKEQQYKSESFSQDLYPATSRFRVTKGMEIGKMGNAGRSFGAHLHFEIRHTQSEVPINPMFFGIYPADTRRPTMQAIKLYEIDSSGFVLRTQERNLSNSGSSTLIEGGPFVINSPHYRLAVQGYDQMDGAWNKNGIYQIEMSQDGIPIFRNTLSQVSFGESGLLNAQIDYQEYAENRKFFAHLYHTPANILSTLDTTVQRFSHLSIKPGGSSRIAITATDLHGNSRTLEVDVQHQSGTVATQNHKMYNYIIPFDEKSVIDLEHSLVVFPDSAVTEKSRVFIAADTITYGTRCIMVKDDEHIPQRPIKLLFKDLGVVDSSALCLVKMDNKDDNVAYTGSWTDGLFRVPITEYGRYCLIEDREPPKIIPLGLQNNMRGKSSIRFKITDNLEAGTKSRRLKYRGLINGKWVLFDYDLKSDSIRYRFDEHCPSGENTIELEVLDAQNNRAYYKYSFVR